MKDLVRYLLGALSPFDWLHIAGASGMSVRLGMLTRWSSRSSLRTSCPPGTAR